MIASTAVFLDRRNSSIALSSSGLNGVWMDSAEFRLANVAPEQDHAVDIPNTQAASALPWGSYRTTVDAIEASTSNLDRVSHRGPWRSKPKAQSPFVPQESLRRSRVCIKEAYCIILTESEATGAG
ncbi:MAG: hypothetical protein IPH63_15235 [Flavobacteriales bacterium]|nr:hypothetical protein [Flavobacteriales bacterium]